MQDKQGSMLLAHNGGLRASLYLLLGGGGNDGHIRLNGQ